MLTFILGRGSWSGIPWWWTEQCSGEEGAALISPLLRPKWDFIPCAAAQATNRMKGAFVLEVQQVHQRKLEVHLVLPGLHGRSSDGKLQACAGASAVAAGSRRRCYTTDGRLPCLPWAAREEELVFVVRLGWVAMIWIWDWGVGSQIIPWAEVGRVVAGPLRFMAGELRIWMGRPVGEDLPVESLHGSDLGGRGLEEDAGKEGGGSIRWRPSDPPASGVQQICVHRCTVTRRLRFR